MESGNRELAQQQADVLTRAIRANAELVRQLDRDLACSGGIKERGVVLCRPPSR